MKKSALLLSLSLILGIISLNAQIAVGLKTGYVNAWQDYGDVQLPDNARTHINAMQVSLTSEFNLNSFLRLHVEPTFIRRGAACEPGFLIFNSDTRLILNYVELPLFVSAFIPVCDKKWEMYFKTGYAASRAISAYRLRKPIGSDDYTSKDELALDKNWGVNPWDHGIYLGYGFARFIGNGKIYFDLMAYGGFEDVVRFTDSKNQSINLSIGYAMNL